MDWNSLRDQVSNISLYDIKAGVRKVQNAVMNYTEMEAKVREATNNEPWGASSSLMQEIANGTFNYQLLNEIMPMIYKRFTEKSAEEWRQIYKALQLMEFLIKNGSERVIDDARSHLSLLKMLRQFHYIDSNGKDQGLNVRNRSKELTELLGDVDRIRAERKKARTTRNKYGGVEGGAGLGGSSSASRYGGFGSETGASSGYGGATRGVYGDGGGFGGESHEDYDEAGRRGGAERFDEYDEYDDGGATAPAAKRKVESTRTKTTPKEPAKPKEPEVDLFDFGDEPTTTVTSNGGSLLSAPPAVSAPADDDDFDDFQSAGPSAAAAAAAPAATAKPNYSSFSIPAPAASTQFAQPAPQPGSQQAGLGSLFATTSPVPSSGSAFSPSPFQAQQAQQPKSTGYQPSGPNYFQSIQTASSSQVSTPTSGLGATQIGSQQTKKPAGGDAFANLLAGSGMKKTGATGQKGMTIADMAKQKSTAGLYGANASAPLTQPSQANAHKSSTGSSGLDDLLG